MEAMKVTITFVIFGISLVSTLPAKEGNDAIVFVDEDPETKVLPGPKGENVEVGLSSRIRYGGGGKNYLGIGRPGGSNGCYNCNDGFGGGFGRGQGGSGGFGGGFGGSSGGGGGGFGGGFGQGGGFGGGFGKGQGGFGGGFGGSSGNGQGGFGGGFGGFGNNNGYPGRPVYPPVSFKRPNFGNRPGPTSGSASGSGGFAETSANANTQHFNSGGVSGSSSSASAHSVSSGNGFGGHNIATSNAVATAR